MFTVCNLQDLYNAYNSFNCQSLKPNCSLFTTCKECHFLCCFVRTVIILARFNPDFKFERTLGYKELAIKNGDIIFCKLNPYDSPTSGQKLTFDPNGKTLALTITRVAFIAFIVFVTYFLVCVACVACVALQR